MIIKCKQRQPNKKTKQAHSETDIKAIELYGIGWELFGVNTLIVTH